MNAPTMTTTSDFAAAVRAALSDLPPDELDELTDGLARALAWSAAWDMTRDAEMSAGDFVALVSRGIAREDDIGVLQGIIRQAVSATYLFTPDHLREQRLEQVEGRRIEPLEIVDEQRERMFRPRELAISLQRVRHTF